MKDRMVKYVNLLVCLECGAVMQELCQCTPGCKYNDLFPSQRSSDRVGVRVLPGIDKLLNIPVSKMALIAPSR